MTGSGFETGGGFPSSAEALAHSRQVSCGYMYLVSVFSVMGGDRTVGTKQIASSSSSRSMLAWPGEAACDCWRQVSSLGLFQHLSLLNFVLIPGTEWPLKSGTRTAGKYLGKPLW